jgi:hypothetical protein
MVNHRVRLAADMRKLVLKIAWDCHFLRPVHPLTGGFLFRRDRRAAAPSLKRLFGEKGVEGPVLPNDWMVDDKVQEPRKAPPIITQRWRKEGEDTNTYLLCSKKFSSAN